MNAMLNIYGHPCVYDQRESDFGNCGWSSKDLLPIFKRMENNLDPKIVAAYPDYYEKRGGPVTITTGGTSSYDELIN